MLLPRDLWFSPTLTPSLFRKTRGRKDPRSYSVALHTVRGGEAG